MIYYIGNYILGRPDVLPVTEISANAWSPGSSKKEHFITVAFANPMRIKQTAIAEAYNTGALKRVLALDRNHDEHLLYSLDPVISNQKGRIFNFFFEETEYEVHGLKLVFNGKMYDGQFYIDAVAVSDSDIPIRATVNQLSSVRKDLKIEALGKNVNSDKSELRPLLSPDGRTLYFSRKNYKGNINGAKDEEDIWHSKWDIDQKSWAPATNIGEPLNNDGKNFVNAVSPNGNSTLLILGSDYEGRSIRPGVSISNSTVDGWSKPVTIPFYSNPNLRGDFDFTLSSDRKSIVFAIQKADTHGGKDLYVSFLQRTGAWSEPLNLGPVVNSINEESSPFLASAGETLYFSSKGFSGFGGSDIYVSKRLDNSWKKWSKPQNLGPNINSSLDEKYFNIPSGGQYAYMSRYISDENADVFRIELPLFEPDVRLITVNATISDDKTGTPIQARLYVDNSNMAIAGNTIRIVLKEGKIYQYRIEADGYLLHNESIDLKGEGLPGILNFNIKLKKEEEVLTFEHINFATNEAVLLPEAFKDLDEIVRLLTENPEIRIEVASHTDNIGTVEDNHRLSRQRAETIFNYLMQAVNINADRIELKWFGESQPIASNKTEEGRRKNRRVEFKIKR